MKRPLLLLASAVLVVGGTGVACMPFHATINLLQPDDLAGDIRARCRRPIIAAWNRDKKGQLALWAVTNGTTGESGYAVRSGAEPYCAAPARRRLIASALAVALGGLLGFLGIRQPRSPG